MDVHFVPRRQEPAQFVFTGEPCVRGHIAKRYARFGGCVECVRENNIKQKAKGNNASQLRAWVKKNRAYSNARRRQHNADNPARRMVNAARRTAKLRGLPFDLTHLDISIPDVCPVLGIKLEPQFGERSDGSPSLDRIVPERGYVKGNVIVISWRANRIKADATLDEMERLTAFYRQLIATKD